MNSIDYKLYSFDTPNVADIMAFTGSRDSDECSKYFYNALEEYPYDKFRVKVCYTEVPVTYGDNFAVIGDRRVDSRYFLKFLNGASRLVVFAATLGMEMEVLITKYKKVSPSRAVIYSAVGASVVENACDAFSEEVRVKYSLSSIPKRFSPGFGDFGLDNQHYIFDLLNVTKNLGICLTDSMLMVPTKSVTAFIRVGEE